MHKTDQQQPESKEDISAAYAYLNQSSCYEKSSEAEHGVVGCTHLPVFIALDTT